MLNLQMFQKFLKMGWLQKPKHFQSVIILQYSKDCQQLLFNSRSILMTEIILTEKSELSNIQECYHPKR